MSLTSIDRPQINAQVSALARDTDRQFVRIQQFKAWLDTQLDAGLIANYGYVQADIDLMRSVVGDLDQLRTIYQGAVNLATAKDFRTFAKQTYAFGSI